MVQYMCILYYGTVLYCAPMLPRACVEGDLVLPFHHHVVARARETRNRRVCKPHTRIDDDGDNGGVRI